MKNWMKNLAKLSLVGGIVFGIWFALLTMFPTPSTQELVKTADADILGFNFGPQSDQEKFVSSILDSGFEKPRTYDWNGNQMFFSTMVTNESPNEVMSRLQHKFVEDGVNERVHLRPAEFHVPQLDKATLQKKGVEAKQVQKTLDDFFGGGIVPVHVGKNRIAMAGASSKNNANSSIEFVKEFADQVAADPKSRKNKRLTKLVKSMRVIEAFKEPQGKTRVTASWSDEEFEMRKIANEGEDIGVNPEIPACIGCKRLSSFRGESGTEKDLGITTFSTKNMSKNQIVEFYTRALVNRGWMPMESSMVMQDAKKGGLMPKNGSELITFSRESKFLNLMLYPKGNGETLVHLTESH